MNEYLKFAKTLALDAGQIMLEYFTIGVPSKNKDDNTPVTIADKKINELVIKRINLKYPNHGVLGEESSSARTNSEYVWVCDPIDGTIPYTFGVPTSIFSLALVKDGVPIVAVMFEPQLNRMYEAVKGSGTKLNGNNIHVNNTSDLENNYVSIPAAQFGIIDISQTLSDLINNKLRIISYLSTTYESTLVASGQILASVYHGTWAWDIAAVKLIVEEAGGKVTDLYGNEQRYDQLINGAIISNGIVHEQFVTMLAKHILETNQL